MHPLLVGRLRLALYLALWVGLSGVLAVTLGRGARIAWWEALWFTLPLAVGWGFVCLTTFYLCHALPLKQATWARIVGTHVGAAGVSALVWLGMGWGVVGLVVRPMSVVPLRDAYLRVAPALFGMALLLFLLSSAIHYGVGAVDASRRAEKRAIELELFSRDAELKALRAQIHPHFLFNSLNSINALIARDPAGARQLCVLLADFLRGSLTLGGKAWIRLDGELEMAQRLLAIEKVRFGDRLVVEVAVDEEVKAFSVPPMILQPLVENAITHGVAHMLEGGRVRLAAKAAAQGVELLVENPHDADAPARRGTGLGLRNVRQRLVALYGEDATMQVSDDGGVFRVRLRIPQPARA